MNYGAARKIGERRQAAEGESNNRAKNVGMKMKSKLWHEKHGNMSKI